jgi:hypothetical protein
MNSLINQEAGTDIQKYLFLLFLFIFSATLHGCLVNTRCKGYVRLSGIVCDMLMIVAHCLQEKWNYVMQGGDMRSKLVDTGPFSEELTRFYAAELTLTTEFLHKGGIIHR